MFDTILLLAGAAEQSILPLALRGHNPLLTVIPVGGAAELAAMDSDLLGRARLIAFVTAEIVPPSVLARLGYGAFNFHPGPPSYPGWAPAHFALYDQAREFGATLHIMVEQVDAGPILDVAFFPFRPTFPCLVWRGLLMRTWPNCSGAERNRLRQIRSHRRRFRSNGAAANTPAAPIGRSATFRSIFQRKNSTGASRCSAATISESRRPSICTASSFAPWRHRDSLSPKLRPDGTRTDLFP
jgi:Formyl transferase